MKHHTYLWFNYRSFLNQQTVMTLGGLGSLTKPLLWVMVWNHQGQLRRMWWQIRVNFETCTLNSHSFGFNSAKPINHSTPNPHLLQHPPLSSCSDRWLLGVWVNTTQQLHKRAPLGSFWRGVPSQACRSAPGPAPHLGRCSERSTGGGQEDTLQYLKLM